MQDIKLRTLESTDDEFILALTTDPDWLKFIGDRGINDLSSAREYIAHQNTLCKREHGIGLMAIERIDDSKLVGLCGLLKRPYLDYPDLGFALLPEYRGKGYVTKAAGLVLASKLARQCKCIMAMTHPENTASQKVLLSLQFVKLGVIEMQTIPSTLFVLHQN
jgi:RimJ/RimL family protein N-acetyltransferase